tara:strand:+ start:202 stop:966 length:765 start_codon:yes stop_codon:yes gene_type:complete
MKVLRLGQSLCSSNAPSGAAFKNLYSLDFDGVDDYVAVGNDSALTITDDITISTWINISSFVDNASILEYALPANETEAGNFLYRITLESSGGIGNDIKLGHEYGSGSNQFGTIDANLSTGVWYHLAAVRDISEKTWTLYVNGVAKTPYTYTNQATGGGSSELQIARAGTTVYYNGNIDELSIFNSAKSSGDITSIYNSGTPTDLSGESGLVGYWRNGDPNGTAAFPTITDDSSNSNDGTMTNMTSGDIVTDVP